MQIRIPTTQLKTQRRAVQKELQKAIREHKRAFFAGAYSGGQFLMDLWLRGIWYDTGALHDSRYVTPADGRATLLRGEVLAGFLAPYAPIVERVHPTKPFHLSRTFAANVGALDQHIAKVTARLVRLKQGIEGVARRYPTKGTFENRRVSPTLRGRA